MPNPERHFNTKKGTYLSKSLFFVRLFSSQADIRNPLRYLLITECCFAAYQEWLAPLLIQAIEAGDLLDSVKKITAIITSPTRLKNLPAATPEA